MLLEVEAVAGRRRTRCPIAFPRNRRHKSDAAEIRAHCASARHREKCAGRMGRWLEGAQVPQVLTFLKNAGLFVAQLPYGQLFGGVNGHVRQGLGFT